MFQSSPKRMRMTYLFIICTKITMYVHTRNSEKVVFRSLVAFYFMKKLFYFLNLGTEPQCEKIYPVFL